MMRTHSLRKFFSRKTLSSAASFNALVQVMPVIEFSPSGIIQKATPLFLTMMGYNAEEITGKHHSLFCSPEFIRSPDYNHFWERLAAGEHFSGKYQRLAKGGYPVWLEASYIPVTDKRGKVCRIIKIATDISERVQSALEQESIINAISRSMAIISFDTTGVVLDVNENFLVSTGYERKDVIGKHHRMFCSEALYTSEEYRQFWQKLNQGEFFSGQFPRLNRRGEPLWLRATYNPVFNNEGHLYKIVKFATDVTQQVLHNHKEQDAAVHAWDMAVQTRASAQTGARVIESSISLMGIIAKEMGVISVDVSRLNSQSESIDEMIETIRSFSMQTRLIALNAAIEAAKAGPAGKSFAVVATEVRHLAARVSIATEEIERVVAGNNILAKDVMGGIEGTLVNTTKGVALMHDAGEVIANIEKNAQGVEIAVWDVASSVKAGYQAEH